MKRKLLVLLCLVMITTLALASCDMLGELTGSGTPSGSKTPGSENDDCVHTFSSDWVYNSSQHWHAATCEHTSEKDSLGAHIDDEQDGFCDICNYKVGHDHTYATDWTTDTVSHWHAATCKHTDSKGDLASHIDANANGKCDVCDAEVKVEVSEDDYALIIDAIFSARGGVASGTVYTDSRFISLGIDGKAFSSSEFDYVFGKDCIYLKSHNTSRYEDKDGKVSTGSSTWEKWQEVIGSDNVFGVYKEDEAPIAMDDAATTETMKGYYFAVSTLASEYGAENILYTLYTLSVSESNYSYLEWNKNSDTGVYTFKFDYIQINRDVGKGEDPNVNYYQLAVSFAHNKNYVLTSLEIVCDCYTNSLKDEVDNDYTYDDTTGTITMKPEGQHQADTYTFVVTQVAGERTYVNENPRSKFLPETFEIFTDATLTTLAPESIDVYMDVPFNLYIGNFLPEGTSITFDPTAFSASIVIDGVTYESDIGVGLYNSLLYFGHTPLGVAPSITCNIHKVGTYPLTVSIGTDDVKTVTVNVIENTAPVLPDGEIVQETEVTLKGRHDWNDMKESEIFAFTAEYTGRYIFIIPENCGAYDKEAYDRGHGTQNEVGAFIDPLADFNYDEDGGEFEVLLEAGQTYEFYLVSYGNQTVTITVRYSAQ